jgi:hypothetical protein
LLKVANYYGFRCRDAREMAQDALKGVPFWHIYAVSLRTNIMAGTIGRCRTCLRGGFIRQPKAGQRHTGQADPEFLQRHAARDRLGQVLSEFIELVVHIFSFVCGSFVFSGCGKSGRLIGMRMAVYGPTLRA